MIEHCGQCRFWRPAHQAANEAIVRRGWCRYWPARVAALSTDWCGCFESAFRLPLFIGEGERDPMVVKGRRYLREARGQLLPHGGVGE